MPDSVIKKSKFDIFHDSMVPAWTELKYLSRRVVQLIMKRLTLKWRDILLSKTPIIELKLLAQQLNDTSSSLPEDILTAISPIINALRKHFDMEKVDEWLVNIKNNIYTFESKYVTQLLNVHNDADRIKKINIEYIWLYEITKNLK